MYLQLRKKIKDIIRKFSLENLANIAHVQKNEKTGMKEINYFSYNEKCVHVKSELDMIGPYSESKGNIRCKK